MGEYDAHYTKLDEATVGAGADRLGRLTKIDRHHRTSYKLEVFEEHDCEDISFAAYSISNRALYDS